MARQSGTPRLTEDESRDPLIEQLAERHLSFFPRAQGEVVSTPGTSETRRESLLRKHAVALLLAAVLLLWGAGFAPLKDGRVLPLDRGGVVVALASEAGSSTAAERLRTAATQAIGRQKHPTHLQSWSDG
jgi:hypothetical protein